MSDASSATDRGRAGGEARPVGPRSARSPWRLAALLGVLLVLNGGLLNLVYQAIAPETRERTILDHYRTWAKGPLLRANDSWRPMRRALRSWRRQPQTPVYQRLLLDGAGNQRFQYPPSSLLVMEASDRTLGRDPEDVNGRLRDITWVFFYLSLIANAAVLIKVLGSGKTRDRSKPVWLDRLGWLSLAVVGALLSASFYPIVKGVTLGQVQVWINALFPLAFLALAYRRPALAGALLGICVWFKPQFWLIALWALVRRRLGFFASFVAVGSSGLLLALQRYGWDNHIDYLRALSFLSRRGESYHPNFSMNGLLSRIPTIWDPALANVGWRWTFPPFNPWIYGATLVSSIAILLWVMWPARSTGNRSELADFGAVALGTTMASPIAWEHHYGILLPLFSLLLGLWWRGEMRCGPWLLGAWVLASNYLAFTYRIADTYWNFLQSYLYFAALVVLFLLVRARSMSPRVPAISSPGEATAG